MSLICTLWPFYKYIFLKRCWVEMLKLIGFVRTTELEWFFFLYLNGISYFWLSLLSDVCMRADTEECLQRENMRTPVPIPQAVHVSPLWGTACRFEAWNVNVNYCYGCFPKNSTFSSKGENASFTTTEPHEVKIIYIRIAISTENSFSTKF